MTIYVEDRQALLHSDNDSRIEMGLEELKTPLLSRKEKLKRFILDFRWPIIFVGSFVVMGIFMFVYRRQFFETLESLSHTLKDMGYKGYVLISLLIFTSAFPPIFGYSTYQTLSGYTFGFSIGFPISYFSGLIGAIACFVLSRYLIKRRVLELLSNYPHLEAVMKAVEKKGFKLFLLVRLSPYPFNMLNVLFSSTDISLFHFSLGTAISLLKIAFHVYVGANLTSFVKHILNEDQDLTPEQIKVEKIKMGIAMTFSLVATIAFFYIYRIAKQAVREVNQINENEDQSGFLNETEPEEIEMEQHRFSIGGSTREERASLDTWDTWDNDSNVNTLNDIPKK